MYNKYFEINKNYQSSVNLELDIDNKNKISEYVPTSDICDVIKRYIKAILGKTKERATTLVGPYGKGKSFLLLVLSFIFSNNYNTKEWKELCSKIKKIDLELYDLVNELKEKNIRLLPVLINSNYDNLDQSFMLGLSDALRKYKIENLIPKNAYSVAIDTIKQRQKNGELYQEVTTSCQDKIGINLKDLIAGLKNYSKESYDQFSEVYYCVTRGVKFNPFINRDIVKTYSDVSNQISEYGFSGVFIIFDEFSKFIESSSNNVSVGLKVIQDFAEMCTRSGKTNQAHLCCVTHKTMSLYKGDNTMLFKTVEGRFTEVRFNRSLEENYQLIASAIHQKSGASSIINKFLRGNWDFVEKINELDLFDDCESLIKDTFPMNPLTSYSLVQLSELVAQTERTLYTFISDANDSSLNSFINNNDIGIFNVDKIYDYFSDLLQKEQTNYIRNIWYRAESLLKKINDYKYKKVIKALAIILMINDFGSFPPTELLIALSLCEPIDIVEKIINDLISNHYLRKNILNNLLSFSLSNTKYIDEKIAILSKGKYKHINTSDVCNSLNKDKYLIPRRHNEERKITRFYSVFYLDEQEFKNISNFDLYFERNYCDGIVFRLLRKDMSISEIKSKIKTIDNERVVLCCPSKTTNRILDDEALRYACLKDIELESSLDDITREELNYLIEETIEDITSICDGVFSNDVVIMNSKYSEHDLNKLLSSILDKYYTEKLIFNNELINKKNLSSQYQKAVNNVIDYYLDARKDSEFKETSPEASVDRSVIKNNKTNRPFKSVISKIKEKIISFENNKCDFYSAFHFLEEKPYGIRKGIIPLLIAKAISELDNTVLLYFESKEVLLNANNLVKAIGRNCYYISCKKDTREKEVYIRGLMGQFEVIDQGNFRKNLLLLANNIKKFFLGQPNIVRNCKKVDYLSLGEELIKLKDAFTDVNLNPYNAIFDKPLLILNTSSYEIVLSYFCSLSDRIGSAIAGYKDKLVKTIKSIFNIADNCSLKMGLSAFMNKLNSEPRLLSKSSKAIYNTIINELNFDDADAVNQLAKCIIGQYVEDRENDYLHDFDEKFTLFLSEIQKNEEDSSNAGDLADFLNNNYEDFSGLGQLLSNNIESAIDEFSDSISDAEKVKILASILKKYI